MDVLETVKDLNQEIFDKTGSEEDSQFFYETDGIIESVSFGKIFLWDSENDEREFSEEKNEYEPLDEFLKKKLYEATKDLLDFLDGWLGEAE